MIDFTKLYKALEILKPNVQWTLVDDTDETSLTEDLFNDIDWITGEDSNGIAITTKTNPHSELTWTTVNNKMIELQTAYDGIGLIQRNREKEYPSIEDQLDEIYHNGIDSWKAKIKITKDKYPK